MQENTVEKRIKYLIAFRLFFSIILLFITILSRTGLTPQPSIQEAIFIPIYIILMIHTASSIVFLILFKTRFSRTWLANFQIYFDIVSVSLLTLASGINTIYSLFYFIPIVFTPLILNRKNSIFVTSTTLTAVSVAYLIHILLNTGIIKSDILTIDPSELKLGRLAATYIATVIAIFIVSILSNILAKEVAVERYLRNFVFDTIVDGVILLDKNNNVILKNKKFDEIKSKNQLLNRITEESYEVNEIGMGDDIYIYHKHNLDNAIQPKLMAIVVRNITDQKEFERQKRQQEFYKYILHISSTLAHEIRNPLTSIKGASQELQKIDGAHNNSKLLQLIVKESDKLNVILNDFLKYASEKPLNLKVCNYEELINDAINLVKVRYREIKIEKKFKTKPIYVKIDPDKISEALLNLLINAAESRDSNQQIYIEITQEPKQVVTKIKDNGKGIPLDIADRLFTPFLTTKKHGTGLGLAIVKKIIDDHQGSIKFETIVGQGTSFYFYLPR